jgi:hypothetical protein
MGDGYRKISWVGSLSRCGKARTVDADYDSDSFYFFDPDLFINKNIKLFLEEPPFSAGVRTEDD